jgi:hypothetical protein
MIESALHFHRTKNFHWKSKSTNFQVFLEHDKRSDLIRSKVVARLPNYINIFCFYI